jgi:hypothetical protein
MTLLGCEQKKHNRVEAARQNGTLRCVHVRLTNSIDPGKRSAGWFSVSPAGSPLRCRGERCTQGDPDAFARMQENFFGLENGVFCRGFSRWPVRPAGFGRSRAGSGPW